MSTTIPSPADLDRIYDEVVADWERRCYKLSEAQRTLFLAGFGIGLQRGLRLFGSDPSPLPTQPLPRATVESIARGASQVDT